MRTFWEEGRKERVFSRVSCFQGFIACFGKRVVLTVTQVGVKRKWEVGGMKALKSQKYLIFEILAILSIKNYSTCQGIIRLLGLFL